ncbi:MAG: FecR protein [Syntrophus sp. PtaU1.Bin208]|nr:MAG: FecR protein [Syntrophus sp. PtaU1.Bin208]
MKKCRVILVAFLFFIALPFPSLALGETASPQLTHTQTQKHRTGKNIRKSVAAQRMTPLKGYVALLQGAAYVQLKGKEDWISLRTGSAIPPQSKLKTGQDGILEIKYEDGSSLLLRSETEVTVLEAWKTGKARLLRDFFLSAGRVVAKVQSATGRSPRFRVHTPSAIASVRGTEFRVAVDKKQETYVEVLKSKVTVDTATNVINLAQGEGAKIKNAVAPPSSPRKLLLAPNPVGMKSFYNTAPVIALAAVGGAQAYRVMIAKDEQGKQLVWEGVVKRGERFAMNSLTDGSYYLLTQSIDPIGLEGAPSEAHPFTIRQNPLPPMIVTPGNGIKAGKKGTTLEWLSVGEAVRYHRQISEDGELQKLVLDKSDLTDLTFKAEGLENKAYTFRIRSIAEDGYFGAWSDPVSFNGSPLPQTSAEDAPDRSSDEITLRSKSVGEGFTYHVQVAKDSQFKEVLVDQRASKPEISVKKPAEAGTYFVRMAAIDRNGKAGEFFPPQNFTIQNRFPYEWVGGGTGLLLLILLLAL